MLRPALIGLVIALAAVAACFAWPVSAVIGLKHALMARDADSVAQRVDFVALKANLQRASNQRIEAGNAGSFLAPLKDAVIEKFSDARLDRVATPAGLIHFVCDHSTDDDAPPPGSSKPCELHGKMQHFGFQSSSRFSMLIRRASGEEFTLVMARHGGSWLLVDLVKPASGAQHKPN